MTIEQKVNKFINVWRLLIVGIILISCVFLVSIGSWILLLGVVPATICLYFVGLWGIAQFIMASMSEQQIAIEMQSKKIGELNAELEAGTLVPGEELDQRMIEAGLRLMCTIEELGPIFGKLNGSNMYEWVDSKEGSKGEVNRYIYVGKASFDADGLALVGDNEENLYVVVDGSLYEHVPITSLPSEE